MKKSTKIILLVIALLTVAVVITAIIMLKAVSGDALLYMNSKLGSFYAHSYRWFCLASIVLVLFWAVFLIAKRKAIAKSFAKRKESFSLKPQEGETESISRKTQDEGKEDSSAQKKEDNSAQKKENRSAQKKVGRFCANCGKQISGNDKFCGFCGGVVKVFDGPGNVENEPEESGRQADA